MGLLFGCSTAVVFLSLISLAFLIIATITPPAVKSFGLAEADGLIYGALGYCSTDSSKCVTGSPAYSVSDLTTLTDWKMDDSARDTLAKILVVMPVAAFLTLISFLFNVFSHFRVFGGSLVFYIIGFVFTLLAFFGSAIAVIITFLLFYPHVKWPAWLLVPAAALNLISVPLVFFALRTNPKSSEDLDNEEYEEGFAEHNLTDLSDGANFHGDQSFRVNNVPMISSFEKLEPQSTLKVISDDTISSSDQFEKVSIKDYSRTHNQNNNVASYNGYQGYNLNASSTDSSDPNAEGAPNLVSTDNHNKGGAVRSEAPKFEPESVRPDFGTTPYPSTYPSAHYNSDTTQQSQLQPAGPFNQKSSGVLGQSNHDGSNLTSDPYYDNDDSQSDFTSVSQRAANPRFYRGLNHQGPSLFPNQTNSIQQQQQQQQYNSGQPGFFNQQQTPPQSGPSHGYQQTQEYSQQQYSPQQPQRPVKDTSGALLAANPDFAITGPAFQKQSYSKKANPIPAGGYRPAYKRLQTGSANKITPASLSADSPYNFR